MHLALQNREISYFEKSRFIAGAALDSLLVMKDDTDLVIVVIDSLHKNHVEVSITAKCGSQQLEVSVLRIH